MKYREQGLPVTDGSQELQQFCAQLEFLLQVGMGPNRLHFSRSVPLVIQSIWAGLVLNEQLRPIGFTKDKLPIGQKSAISCLLRWINVAPACFTWRMSCGRFEPLYSPPPITY